MTPEALAADFIPCTDHLNGPQSRWLQYGRAKHTLHTKHTMVSYALLKLRTERRAKRAARRRLLQPFEARVMIGPDLRPCASCRGGGGMLCDFYFSRPEISGFSVAHGRSVFCVRDPGRARDRSRPSRGGETACKTGRHLSR